MIRTVLCGVAVVGLCALSACSNDEPDDGLRYPIVDERTGYALVEPVEVFRDEWGTPHIYASGRLDLVFAQGYETAADRMWNLDYLRRLIYGELSEVYGPAFLADDVQKRALGTRRIVEANERFHEEHHRDILSQLWAYAHGINAWLDDVEAGRNGATRPPEFDRVGPDWMPARWTAQDSLAIAQALILSQSFQADIEVAIFAAESLLATRGVRGQEAVADFLPFTPVFGSHVIEDAPTPDSALSMIRESLSGKGRGADGAAGATPVSVADEVAAVVAGLSDAERERVMSAFMDMAGILASMGMRDEVGSLGGSNSWAVAGTHAPGQGALMCNDTHMPMAVPSVLYPTHLVDTSRDDVGAVGYAGPGTPMVLIGNNAHVAWGLTNAFADVNDLYRDAPSQNANVVQFNGEMVDVVAHEEEFIVSPLDAPLTQADLPSPRCSIAEQDATRARVRCSLREIPHHGPVLNDVLPPDLGNIIGLLGLFSVRWVGFNTETTVYAAMDEMLVASSVDEQIHALRYFNSGVMSWSLADARGNIAYLAAGAFPDRPDITQHPPYRMYPGDGSAEWRGVIPLEDVPRRVNPAKGYFVHANNSLGPNTLNNTPENGGFYFGHFFDLGTRAWRITEELERMIGDGGVTMDAMRALQVDNRSVFATLYLPHMLAIEPRVCAEEVEDDRACRAVRLLADWDGFQGVDSAAAAIFTPWLIHFLWETYRDEVGLFGALVGSELDNTAARAVAHWLNGRPPMSGNNYFDDATTADVEESAEDMMERGLWIALQELQTFFDELAGEATQLEDWRWGPAHLAIWKHPVWEELGSEPYENDSGFRTINAADFALYPGGAIAEVPYVMNEASQIRYCVSFEGDGEWDIWGGLNGGASARSDSPHYGDQREGWIANETYPLHFTRQAVEAAARSQRTLPAGFPVTTTAAPAAALSR